MDMPGAIFSVRFKAGKGALCLYGRLLEIQKTTPGTSGVRSISVRMETTATRTSNHETKDR